MYAIICNFTSTYGGARYQSTIEYADDEARALQRLRDWAGWHGATDRLSPDGRYFDKTDGTAFRLERIAPDAATAL